MYAVQLGKRFVADVAKARVSQGGRDGMDMIKEINGTFFTRPGDYMDAQAPPTFLPSFKQSVATSTAYTLIKRGEVPHCTYLATFCCREWPPRRKHKQWAMISIQPCPFGEHRVD